MGSTRFRNLVCGRGKNGAILQFLVDGDDLAAVLSMPPHGGQARGPAIALAFRIADNILEFVLRDAMFIGMLYYIVCPKKIEVGHTADQFRVIASSRLSKARATTVHAARLTTSPLPAPATTPASRTL